MSEGVSADDTRADYGCK